VKRLTLILPVLLLAVAACGSDANESEPGSTPAPATIEVTGNLTYLQKIALVPGGVATVTVEDVSIADAASTVITEQTIELGEQQVPIPFDLTLDPADLDPRGTYSFRASIEDADGALVWTTDTMIPIESEPAGDIDLGDVVLVQVVPTEGEAGTTDGAASLIGSWTVTEIDGETVQTDPPITLEFADDVSLSGNAGCNRYTTGYATEGDQLVLGAIAGTMMACLGDVADVEDAFLAILNDGPTFELVDGDTQLQIEAASGSSLSASR